MKHFYKAMTIVFIMLYMTGCTQNDSGSTDTGSEVTQEIPVVEENATVDEIVETVPVVASFGGTLRIASDALTTFDPLTNDKQSTQQVMSLIYESLFVLDQTFKPVPELAESYTFEDDGKTLIITLRSDVLFHDGTPLTTADVVYSIDHIKDALVSSYKNNVLPIRKTTVVDAQTVKFYYDQGYAFSLNDLTFPIVSKTYHKSSTYNEMVPMGTGPYMYVDYQLMQHFELTANPTWHGGAVYIENIAGTIMNDNMSLENMFDQNLIDVMNPSQFDWLKYSENEDRKIESYTSSYYDFIGFNFDNPLLQDKKLRQAFAYAVNREFIVYDRFIDHAILVNAPIIPDSWYATDKANQYTYDIDQGKKLIGSSYKDMDGDGYFDQPDLVDSTLFTTIELHMLINKDNGLRVTTAPLIQSNFEQLGFRIVLDLVDSATYYERVALGEYDLLYGGWKMSLAPDYTQLFATGGLLNYIHYTSEPMDAILTALANAYSDEQIISNVAAFENHMIENVPYISLYFLDGAVMSHGNVYGEFNSNTETMFEGIEHIYLDLK